MPKTLFFVINTSQQLFYKRITYKTFIHKARMSSLIKDKAYVNGEWVAAKSGATYNVTNPANGSIVGTVPDMKATDTEVAIQSAYKAFQTWKKTTAKERGEMLKKAYRIMLEQKEELARIITLENGKPTAESMGEINYGAGFCEWFAEEGRRIQGGIVSSPFPSKKIFTLKQPIGVCGMITPWNFPNAMITRKACAALAAGCTVVIKPGEDTPLSALALCEVYIVYITLSTLALCEVYIVYITLSTLALCEVYIVYITLSALALCEVCIVYITLSTLALCEVYIEYITLSALALCEVYIVYITLSTLALCEVYIVYITLSALALCEVYIEYITLSALALCEIYSIHYIVNSSFM
ncbi:hypothetical protein ACF0H5_013784 [Mactra antiquata]